MRNLIDWAPKIEVYRAWSAESHSTGERVNADSRSLHEYKEHLAQVYTISAPECRTWPASYHDPPPCGRFENSSGGLMDCELAEIHYRHRIPPVSTAAGRSSVRSEFKQKFRPCKNSNLITARSLSTAINATVPDCSPVSTDRPFHSHTCH